MENTPTKVFTRMFNGNNESSSSICVQCNQPVFNPFYKRRLFSAESCKSKACQHLEIVLRLEINQTTVETDIICRNCNDKNTRLVRKLEEARSVYEKSKNQRHAQGNKNQLLCVKRLAKDGRQTLAKKRLNMGSDDASTCTILESLGSRFDEKLYEWKDAVEKGAQKEEDLHRQLNDAKSLKDHELAMKITTELIDHQDTMHPGYSFTGDNVGIRVTPRQMTMKNQTSDIHLFQYVAFKNRVSGNHLSNEIPNVACKDIPLTSFLPSVSEQQLLVNELTVLVGHKWATYIPSLKWFDDFLPKHIQHNHMNETKTKTEKVILFGEKTQSSNFAPFSVLLFDVNKENCPPLLRAIELCQHSWQS